MNDLIRTIRARESTRTRFDQRRRVDSEKVKMIIEAARWAPTPHNMQNFEIVAVDDPELLREIGGVKSRTSEGFIRENYEQLSFSRRELSEKRVGILGEYFPPEWRNPATFASAARNTPPRPLSDMIDGSPLVMIVLYDPDRRAPASEGDFLGIMGLGCVMENMWLMATALGLGVQVMSVFGGSDVGKSIGRILGVPASKRIAYALRLGYPAHELEDYPRVRRESDSMSYHNGYGTAHQGLHSLRESGRRQDRTQSTRPP